MKLDRNQEFNTMEGTVMGKVFIYPGHFQFVLTVKGQGLHVGILGAVYGLCNGFTENDGIRILQG